VVQLALSGRAGRNADDETDPAGIGRWGGRRWTPGSTAGSTSAGHRSPGRETGYPGDGIGDGESSAPDGADPDTRSLPGTYLAAQRAARAAAVILLVAGPLLGGAALFSARSTTTTPAAGPPPSDTAAGPGAFASAYVQTWLGAGIAAGGAASTDLSVWGPPTQLAAPAGAHRVSWVQPSRVEQAAPGYWAVMVAAEVSDLVDGRWQPPVLRWFATSVLARGPAAAGGPDPVGSPAAYTATTLPHQVTAPAGLAQPDLAAGQPLPASGNPVADTVTAFLLAYLTGQDVSRLVSPGTQLSPVTGSGVVSLQLTSLSGDDSAAATAAGPVPAAAVAVSVVATVATVERSGRGNPASYGLVLSARAGRWEVRSLDPAPALATGEPLPTPQPSAPSDPG